LTKFYNICYY